MELLREIIDMPSCILPYDKHGTDMPEQKQCEEPVSNSYRNTHAQDLPLRLAMHLEAVLVPTLLLTYLTIPSKSTKA